MVPAPKSASVKKDVMMYKLKVKGALLVITQAAKINSLKEAGKTDAAGNVIIESKPQPDPIEKSL